MVDVLPFLALAMVAFLVYCGYLVSKVRSGSSMPKPLHDLLLEYDDIAQEQLNNIDIKPFLPEEMQKRLHDMHIELRKLL